MVLDYKNNKDFTLKNGVSPENKIGETHFTVQKKVTGLTFTNFNNLCLDDAVFENCSFENCERVSTESCRMIDCTFKNIKNIEGIRTDFTDCRFYDSSSQGAFLVIDSHGCVKGCIFKNISAKEDDGYIIYSVYGKKSDVEIIKNCQFINCKTESEDKKLCYCAYFKPFSSYNTVKVNNLDSDTCEFV